MQRSWSPRDGRQSGVAEETRQPGQPGQESASQRQAYPEYPQYPQGQPQPSQRPPQGAPATSGYGAPYVGPIGPATGAGWVGDPYGAPRNTGALQGFSGPLRQAMGPISGQSGQSGQSAGQPNLDELANRATALLQRIRDVERSLTGQEWWLLGKAMPEARLLAEIASLLAVARGEMEGFLADYCHRILQAFEIPEPSAEATDEVLASMNDPRWLAAQREQAIGHLRMVAAALPAMSQYARTLRIHAERLGVAPAALDPLTIVMDRLGDAQETLQQPPA